MPSNDRNSASEGSMVGAAATFPCTTIATCWWNCCSASESHARDPASVRSRRTVHPVPGSKLARARRTCVETIREGPRKYRAEYISAFLAGYTTHSSGLAVGHFVVG